MSKGNTGFHIQVVDASTLSEGLRRLRVLERSLEQDSALMSAMVSAANVIRRAGIANLRRKLLGHGSKGVLLRQSRVLRRKREIAVAAGFRRPQGAHAHLVDLGTGHRYTKKGQYRGEMPANHFWTEAKEQKSDEAKDVFLDAVDRAITRILMK